MFASKPPGILLSMVTAEENAARILACETIKPRDRVFELAIAFAAQIQKSREGLEGDQLGIDPCPAPPPHLNIRPRNDSGETKTADRSAEHAGILFRTTDHE